MNLFSFGRFLPLCKEYSLYILRPTDWIGSSICYGHNTLDNATGLIYSSLQSPRIGNERKKKAIMSRHIMNAQKTIMLCLILSVVILVSLTYKMQKLFI